MRKIYFFILALFFIIFSFVIGFMIGDKQPKDIIEGISGFVSYTNFENDGFLYIDIVPDVDSDGDGLIENDKDEWVSGFDEDILRQLAEMEVGDWFSAKDLWKADESLKSEINHYYILEFYDVQRKNLDSRD